MSDYVDVTSSGESKDNDDVVVTDTVGGVVLLNANKYRKSALIVNVGDEPIRVTTDGSDPTSTHGKPVGAGGALSLTAPYCPNDVVKAICVTTALTTNVNASEVS